MGVGEINQIPRKEISLEQRVSRLEGRLGWRREEFILQPMALRATIVLLPVSLILAYQGLGLPNHYYQVLFSVLTLALAYHRGLFARPKNTLHWLIVVLNILVFSLLLKLFIGAGRAQPLAWIKVPTLEGTTEDAKGQWLQVLPQLKLHWGDSPVSTWIIDLTQVQTFFLLLTLVGGLFSFQPFVSFTAILLIISSLPAFLTFSWEWVFPAIITASIAFYLQTASANLE